MRATLSWAGAQTATSNVPMLSLYETTIAILGNTQQNYTTLLPIIKHNYGTAFIKTRQPCTCSFVLICKFPFLNLSDVLFKKLKEYVALSFVARLLHHV